MKSTLRIFLTVVFIFFTLFLLISGFLIFNFDYQNIFLKFLLIDLWLIFVIFIYVTIYKIYKDFKDKKKGINPFKKYDPITEADLFLNDIENIKGYKKIIRSSNGFILINEAGIFEIRFIYCKGTLIGDINNRKWKANKVEIDNPFILKSDVVHYLVLTKNMIAQVNVRLVTKTKLTFVLEKHLNKKIYNESDIDRMYEKIRGEIYGYNQN